jgi:hypothetical protein
MWDRNLGQRYMGPWGKPYGRHQSCLAAPRLTIYLKYCIIFASLCVLLPDSTWGQAWQTRCCSTTTPTTTEHLRTAQKSFNTTLIICNNRPCTCDDSTTGGSASSLPCFLAAPLLSPFASF